MLQILDATSIVEEHDRVSFRRDITRKNLELNSWSCCAVLTRFPPNYLRSHEFLAIFLDRRRLKHSVSSRIVLFLCSLNSQLLGVTMFYYL